MNLASMLNVYRLHSSEEAGSYGTEVAKWINDQSHQHVFSSRDSLGIHGANNSGVLGYLVPAIELIGSEANPWGNEFLAKETLFQIA